MAELVPPRRSPLSQVTDSQVWRSVFRHGYADTPRNRVLQVAANVWLHLHPSKIRRHAVRFRFTWCAGGLTFLLYLVTVVTGELARGHDIVDVIAATFPGGSVTGAPKRRAMEIIEELEPHRREVYCGAIGYATPAGRLDMNIPIRTTLAAEGELRFYAGGGIVADSSPEAEFEETEVKIAAIRRALPRFSAGAAPPPAKVAMRRELLAARDALFSGGSEAFSAQITARLRSHPRAARAAGPP